jgi:serine/threonine protein kinase/Tfp pilus assembly protein PilF
MGVVYKAKDTNLDRIVALKFLPQHLLADKEAEQRFISEAKAASSFDHPNICTIYDINKTEDDQFYIVMGYYAGETLKKKLNAGPLQIDTAINYATQIANGLTRAHEAGIIHRDIKPENVMVTDRDEVKILDFGLAKTSGEPSITKMGSTVGTVSYMSPEQTKGDNVDHRSDIWSLGVVLYEMLTGRLPFKGDYEQAIIYSILNEEPETVSELNRGVSPQLNNVITRTLEKNPDGRYQKISALLDDLIAIQDQLKDKKLKQVSSHQPKLVRKSIYFYIGITVVILLITLMVIFFFQNQEQETTISSLAVLPFSNTNPDPDTDFLGFALADEIIGDLAYLKSITVRASSSIRQYENQIADPVTAGNDLEVDYVLTGNYLKQANDMRLNIELVNVHTNEMIWRVPVEVEYKNAFRLQDIVSEKVVKGLEIQFSQDERERMRTDIPKNPLAYEYYLRSLSYPHIVEGEKLAIAMIEKSIQLDSTFAPAFAELGWRHNRLGQWSFSSTEHKIESERAFLKALSLNDELPDAYVGLSNIYTDIGKTEKAVELTQRALKIRPNDAYAHFRLSYTYRYAGMLKQSEQEIEIALALDPKNPRFVSGGLTYLYLGNYEKALQTFELNRESAFSLHSKGEIFLRMGHRKQAVEYFDSVLRIKGEELSALDASIKKAYILNNKTYALSQMEEYEQANPQDGEVWILIAQNYALLGNIEGCIRALKKTIELGFFNYPFMLKDSFLDPVRDDLEFQRVLEFAKEKYEAFKNKYFPEK